MQLADHFEVLLKNTVNLSLSSLETLDSRVDAIYNTLEADAELGPYVVDKIPQGSWAHETIIKPPGNCVGSGSAGPVCRSCASALDRPREA